MTVRRLASAPLPWLWLMGVVLIVLLSFVIRIFDLSGQSLWYDEGFSVLFAKHNDVPSLFVRAAQLDLNTPLYYVLLQVWMAGLGASEFAVRLLSVFASVVSVALAYRLSAIVLRRSSLIAAALITVSSVSILAAQEVRMYALAGCLCLAATAALLMALRDDRSSLWLGWAVLGILAFATHVLCALVVGAHIVVSVLLRRVERQAIGKPHLFAMAGVGLLIVAWVAFIWPNRDGYGVSYAASAGWSALMIQTLAGQSLPRLLPAEWVVPAGVAVSVALALSCIALMRMRGPRCLATALAATAVVSLLAIAAFCAVSGKFSPRYPTIAVPVSLATCGIAIAGAQSRGGAVRTLTRVSLAAVVVGFSAATLALRISPLYANEDFRNAAAYIRANLQPDEAVLLVSGHFAPVFEYYFGAERWTALPDDPVLNVNHTLDYERVVPPSNAALTGKHGAWLLLWQDDVIDPTGLVPTLLRRQSHNLAPALDTRAFNGLRLQRYRFFQPYQALPERLPRTESRIEANRPERGLSGLGCYQPQMPRTGDGWMEVHCVWQIKPFVPLSGYTQVSLRLFDENGRQVLQSDQAIAPNGLPYAPFEKPILGVYFIEMPPGLPAGEYTLRAIPYTEREEISPEVMTPVRVLP